MRSSNNIIRRGFSPSFHTALLCIDFIFNDSIHCWSKMIIQQFQAYVLVTASLARKRKCLYYGTSDRMPLLWYCLVWVWLGHILIPEPISVARTIGCCDWSGMSHIPLSEPGGEIKMLLTPLRLKWVGDYFSGGSFPYHISREWIVYNKPIKYHYALESVFFFFSDNVCLLYVCGRRWQRGREEAQTDGQSNKVSIEKSGW